MISSNTKEAANLTKDFAANDVKNAVTKSADQARSRAGHVVEDLSAYANEAGKKVRNFIDHAGDEFGHASDKVSGEIRANPVRSSVIALGIGFVLGALVRR
jgi:ElaB/YqjD/DUF883 family membrane-anchored ribosome-binding protein